MLHSLLAYDANGNVIGTLDYMVAKDDDGNVIGLLDFAEHEKAGGKLRAIWNVENAVGSATWPEWMGGAVHDFKVELDANKRAVALVHKRSGHRRERAAIEAEIAAKVSEAKGAPADLRAVLGGPGKPLLLDQDGRTRPRPARSPRPLLPVVRRAGDLPPTSPEPQGSVSESRAKDRQPDGT